MRRTNLNGILNLARLHLGGTMETSARLNLAEAIAFQNDGQWDYAINRAMRSLAYSVGIMHKDYARAYKMAGYLGAVGLPKAVTSEVQS